MEITEWPIRLKVRLVGSKRWRCIAYWCIQNNWSIIGVYFSIVCDFRPWRASQNQSHFAPFAFFFFLLFSYSGSYNLSFSCLVILYRKQACWTHIWHDLSGSESGVFLHRGLRFSGYLVYLQMLPFCILQRVSKHCVAMLILLNLHWQAALMVFFYVFVWLFLVSMATDCTWWQATGRYNVNLGLVSFCLIFPFTLYSNLTLR